MSANLRLQDRDERCWIMNVLLLETIIDTSRTAEKAIELPIHTTSGLFPFTVLTPSKRSLPLVCFELGDNFFGFHRVVCPFPSLPISKTNRSLFFVLPKDATKQIDKK